MLNSFPEPSIRYARSHDGISLAYWVIGQGPPLIVLPTLVSNIESEWHGERARVYRRLAEHHQVIRYDGRGHGLSDRRPEELSLAALVGDLEAVADELGFERFSLFASTVAGATALAFAAQHPERVDKVVLWNAFASFADYFHSSIGDALALAGKNWDLFTLTAAHIRVGWLRAGQARVAAQLLRDSVERDFYLREVALADELDASCYLADVRVPVEVLCRRDFDEYELEVSRRLAASIPTASLNLVSGNTNGIYDERDEAVREIERFLGVDHVNTSSEPRYSQIRANELTPREAQILHQIAEGRRNKEIAADLGLSVYTVSRHVATIYVKIGVHGRAEAARHAISLGLASVPEMSPS